MLVPTPNEPAAAKLRNEVSKANFREERCRDEWRKAMAKFEGSNRQDRPALKQAPPISLLSIVAIVLALASTVYFLNDQLIILPIISFVLGWIAWLHTSRTRNRLGNWLAVIALSFASFTLTSVQAYQKLRHQHLTTVASQHAEHWLSMVQDGELYRTHQLTFAYPARCDPSTDLEAYYAQTEMPEPDSSEDTNYLTLPHYTTVEPEVSIRSDGQKCRIVNEGLIRSSKRYKKENFIMQFRLERADETLTDQVFLLEMRRTQHFPPIGPQWSCSAIENTDPPIERKLAGVPASK